MLREQLLVDIFCGLFYGQNPWRMPIKKQSTIFFLRAKYRKGTPRSHNSKLEFNFGTACAFRNDYAHQIVYRFLNKLLDALLQKCRFSKIVAVVKKYRVWEICWELDLCYSKRNRSLRFLCFHDWQHSKDSTCSSRCLV